MFSNREVENETCDYKESTGTVLGLTSVTSANASLTTSKSNGDTHLAVDLDSYVTQNEQGNLSIDTKIAPVRGLAGAG